MVEQTVTQASNYFDLQGLDQLRQKAQGNSKESIREVANQFESMFATMLIKSMRQANEAFETESPFNNKQTKFYTDMQDHQLAIDISRHGSLGLGDALVRQLDPSSIARPTAIPTEQLIMSNNKPQMIDLDKLIIPSDLNSPDKSSVSTLSTKQKTPEFTDKTSFIEKLIPYAKKTAQALGISPAVLIAQSALETGWGKKIISFANEQSSFNLFNIKANHNWQGEQVAKNSIEIEDGIGIKRRSNFRAYDSLADSFADYGKFIASNKRYQPALQNGQNAERYIEELQQAGYATDPQYAEKIKTIMRDGLFKQVVAGGEING